MAKSKDTMTASYDAVRDRILQGETIDAAIQAELPGCKLAPTTLKAAYLALAREKGHTKIRTAKPALDIVAFKGRFDAAVAKKEAEERSEFAALVEQLGDHLGDVVSKHPPEWVRKTIAASGVSVTKEEFAKWLGTLVDTVSKKQNAPKAKRSVKETPAAVDDVSGGSRPDADHEKDPQDDDASRSS